MVTGTGAKLLLRTTNTAEPGSIQMALLVQLFTTYCYTNNDPCKPYFDFEPPNEAVALQKTTESVPTPNSNGTIVTIVVNSSN